MKNAMIVGTYREVAQFAANKAEEMKTVCKTFNIEKVSAEDVLSVYGGVIEKLVNMFDANEIKHAGAESKQDMRLAIACEIARMANEKGVA